MRWSDSENLDMIGADVSEVYEELPELSDLINRQNAQTRGRVYSDASIRSAAAEILNAVSAEVAEARRGELELMLRDAFVNWSRRGISAEAFMEQARKIGQWVIDNGKQAKVESRRMTEERNKSRSAALVIYPEEKSMVGRVPVI